MQCMFTCVNNHNAKFEHKFKKTARVTVNTNQTAPKNFGWNKWLSSTPVKISNVYKIVGAHHEKY